MIEALLSLSLQTASLASEWTAYGSGTTTGAYVKYDAGVTISVLCQNQNPIVVLSGLPVAEGIGGYRRLDINILDDTPRPSTWIVPTNDRAAAASTAPHIHARLLRSAEKFVVRVPENSTSEEQLHNLILPLDRNPLEAVMTACGVPFEDANDINYVPPVSFLTWERPPRTVIPRATLRFDRVDIIVECSVDATGQPQDCVIADERPARSGMAQAALESIRSGRVRTIDGDAFKPGARFRASWNIRIEE